MIQEKQKFQGGDKCLLIVYPDHDASREQTPRNAVTTILKNMQLK